MKTITHTAAILFLACLMTALLPAQGYAGPESLTLSSDTTRILLINPTEGDLEDMIVMVETGIAPVARPGLIAVYGTAVERDGAAIQERFASRQLAWLRFELVAGTLTPDNLFGENPCSEAFRRLFNASDAALFYGGADLPPVLYGSRTDLLTGILSPQRHYFELSLLFHLLGGDQNPAFTPLLAEKPDYVIRAFCLGMQSMNVATGGTMYQDIPNSIYKLRYVEEYLALDDGKRHDNYWYKLAPAENLFWCHFQPIRLRPDGWFVRTLGRSAAETPVVCSSHHQAVHRLGRHMAVAATSLDGKVVEALVHTQFKNVLGVQFHPENLAIYRDEGLHKETPADTLLTTMHAEIKARGSLDFHLAFWRQFGAAL